MGLRGIDGYIMYQIIGGTKLELSIMGDRLLDVKDI